MSFRETRLDIKISYDSSSGPTYRTDIIELPGGTESRRSWWSNGRKKFRIRKELLSREDVVELEAFYRAMKGRGFGFRLRDWNSYLAVDETVEVLTGTTAQLQIVYTESVTGTQEIQKIPKPVLAADVENDQASEYYSPDITLKRNGSAFASSGNWSIDRTTGIITFNADQTGQTILWSGSYDWPVRFDTDEAMFHREALDIHDWSDITMIELRI